MARPMIAAVVAAAVCGCGGSGAAGPAAARDARTARTATTATTATTARPAPARAAAARAAAMGHDWPMFGRVPSRTSAIGAIGIGKRTAPGLRRRTVALPGIVDSAPIFLHDVMAGGATRDLFVMGTTYGRAIAVDAGTAQIVWTFTPSGYDSWAGSYRITTATPVASADRRHFFTSSPDGRVHKLSIADGSESGGRWPVPVTRLPQREKLSPSFGLMHGRLIVGTGGYIGDEPPYQGHIVAIRPGGGAIVGVTNALCSDRHAVIDPTSCGADGAAFFSRSGAVQLPDGTLAFTSGDGPYDGAKNLGDSVIRVSRNASRILGSWTPKNQRHLDYNDVDLGSTGPVPIGGGSILQSGKDGRLHVFALRALRRRTLGHERQNIAAPGGAPVFTAPAVLRRGGRTWVFVASGSGTAGYIRNRGRLRRRWQTGRPGTSPIAAGGLLWVYDPTGALVAYLPRTGAVVASLPAGSGHWNSPVPGIGVIALPEGDGNTHRTSGTLNLYSVG